MYNTDKYYSKDVNGNIIVWYASVTPNDDGSANVDIFTGRRNNPRKITRVLKEGKNTNKANRTSPYEQGVKEIKAKAQAKFKKGYRPNRTNDTNFFNTLTINKIDANDTLKPMKAKHIKYVTKFKFPYILQLKINGFRGVLGNFPITENDGMFAKTITKPRVLSNEGFEYIIPHITEAIPESVLEDYKPDGELYVHGEKTSQIKERIPMRLANGTITNNSMPVKPVKFYCFDLSVPDIGQLERLRIKTILMYNLKADTLTLNTSNNGISIDYYKNPEGKGILVNVEHTIVYTIEEVYKWLELAVKLNFEGVVLRSFHDEYYFGGRRFNMIKAKKIYHGEFEILDIVKVNEINEEGGATRTFIQFILRNDITTGTFKCTPEGTEQDRLYFLGNKEEFIGRKMTARYYERTINRLPAHATGEIREEWDLTKDDKQIEG